MTGKLEAFAKHAKIIHIDIDPSELNKNKPAHIPIVSDVKFALQELTKVVEPRQTGNRRLGRSVPAMEVRVPLQIQ